MSNNALLLGDGNTITRQNLNLVPVPAPTKSYTPVPWSLFVDTLEVHVTNAGYDVSNLKMTCSGIEKATGWPRELFGVMSLDRSGTFIEPLSGEGFEVGHAGLRPQIAFRSSYNHHYAPAACAGASVMVCSNGEMHGDFMVVLRKQTTYVLNDLDRLVSDGVGQIEQAFGHACHVADDLMSVPLTLDEGYEMLGLALGHGVVTPTVANVAFKDWTNPRHEEFSERNMWSFKNCLTEGAKKASAGSQIDLLTGISAFMKKRSPSLGSDIYSTSSLAVY